MLKFLENFQTGFIPPEMLASAETTKRCYMLELSKYKDVEPVHVGGINSLHLETIEGRYLLSGGADGSVVIHDLINLTGTPKYTCKIASHVKRQSKYAHKFSVESVQWYPFDTGLFTSSGMDRKLKIWDTNRLKPAETFELDANIFCHQMSPIALKHNLIAVGTSNESLKLVDLKSGSYTHELRGHKGSVLSLAWSTCNSYLLASGSVDNKVILWDIRSARGKLKSLDQHNGDSGSASSQAVNTAHSGAVNSVLFNESGNYLVTYGTDDRIRVWDVHKGLNTMVNFGKVFNDARRNTQIDCSSAAKDELIFIPSESNICVFNMHSGIEELYSGGNDRNILIWTPDMEQEMLYEEHITLKSKHGNKQDTKLTVLNKATADAWSSDEDS